MTHKRTATITFHAAHNYGSMLQAYALQQTLLALGVENQILNFRSPIQKQVYRDPRIKPTKDIKLLKRIKRLLYRFLNAKHIYSLGKKYDLFEKFLQEQLILTKEFSSFTDNVIQSFDYDYYITGSDQCWNTHCIDFNWAYYLDFTDSCNKISYASSFGPFQPDEEQEKIVSEIKKFKNLSAREKAGAEFITQNTDLICDTLPDPTLLLSKKQWEKLSNIPRIISKKYIFVYSPIPRQGVIEFALYLSERYKLPIIISNKIPIKDKIKIGLKKNVSYKLDVGPTEFLNLIQNAEFVVSGSFHALIFSLIYNTPFFAIDGCKDNRMRQILTKANCLDRAVDGANPDSYSSIVNNAGEIPNFDEAIKEDTQKAIKYLKESLDLV